MNKPLPLQASGVAMALAAAGLLSGCQSSPNTTASAETANTDLAHCYGVHACKGHNDCKSANNVCKGQASCKGQGFVAMPTKACGDIGGKVGDQWRGTIAKAHLSHCYGVNVCGGHNECKTAKYACAGKASCKGAGFAAMPAKACADVGGKTS